MREDLEVYLNDHLAGSVAGLEIMDHLIDLAEGSPHQDDLRRLKKEIEEDRDELLLVMKRLGLDRSMLRKAVSWLTEKGAELKIRFDDPSGGPFMIFESLEVISLGIEGKRGLWKALAAAAGEYPELAAHDLSRLRKRARNQRKTVEALRLGYAVDALGPEK